MRPLSRRINVAQRGTRAVRNIEHDEIDTGRETSVLNKTSGGNIALFKGAKKEKL